MMSNLRIGLSAHLGGTMNGMLVIILGLIWHKILLHKKWLTLSFWLSIYGSFANFLAVLIGAITGAGKMMPIAGGIEGTALIEGFISFLHVSLSLVMIFVGVVVLIGLFKNIK